MNVTTSTNRAALLRATGVTSHVDDDLETGEPIV